MDISQKVILILEDSRLILVKIKGILKKADFKVVTAENGKEGLLQLDEILPDLIISDIMMPEMDGFEFCKKVRENPVTRFTPFIFLSSREALQDKLQGFEMGADDYLTKPFNEQELLTRVSSSLRKMDALLKLSHEDALTKVSNHRSFQENLSREIKRSTRQKTLLSMAMLDIDHFKKFNDTYGHKVGDFVLFEFAQFIKKRIREADFFARYGGEEFALILPDTNKEKAFTFLDQIREDLSNKEIINPLNKNEKLRITFSGGIAEFPTYSQSKDKLFLFADEALYKAKKAGRNQICFE